MPRREPQLEHSGSVESEVDRMNNGERKWTLLLRRETGTIYRVREGDRPISTHGGLDFERVVVVPASRLEGAVSLLGRMYGLVADRQRVPPELLAEARACLTTHQRGQ